MGPMAAFRRFSRRSGTIGLALTALDLWSRLPPAQRRHLIKLGRKHGPAMARAAARQARAKRSRKGPL